MRHKTQIIHIRPNLVNTFSPFAGEDKKAPPGRGYVDEISQSLYPQARKKEKNPCPEKTKTVY